MSNPSYADCPGRNGVRIHIRGRSLVRGELSRNIGLDLMLRRLRTRKGDASRAVLGTEPRRELS